MQKTRHYVVPLPWSSTPIVLTIYLIGHGKHGVSATMGQPTYNNTGLMLSSMMSSHQAMQFCRGIRRVVLGGASSPQNVATPTVGYQGLSAFLNELSVAYNAARGYSP